MVLKHAKENYLCSKYESSMIDKKQVEHDLRLLRNELP